MTYIGKLAEVEGADPTAGGAAWKYMSTDNLGSVRALRNESRTALAQYECEPYGGAFQFSGPTPDLGFTGHRWDAEAGMYYAPFRMYDPDIMRWISTDPAGMVDGPNTWAYVNGDPLNGVDPLGLQGLDLYPGMPTPGDACRAAAAAKFAACWGAAEALYELRDFVNGVTVKVRKMECRTLGSDKEVVQCYKDVDDFAAKEDKKYLDEFLKNRKTCADKYDKDVADCGKCT